VTDPKKYFREYHENLHSRIWRLAIKLRILEFSTNVGANEPNLEVWNLSPAFFGPVEESLRTDIIVTLHNLFDERSSERTLLDYLKETKKYIRGLMGRDVPDAEVKRLTSEIDAQMARADSLKPIVDSVKFSRDKYYAHSEGKYFDKPYALVTDKALPFADVVKLIDFCKEVLKWHELKVLDYTAAIWSEDSGKEQLDPLFCFVRRYFKMCDEVREKLGPGELLEMIKL
jgi:AbiU2